MTLEIQYFTGWPRLLNNSPKFSEIQAVRNELLSPILFGVFGFVTNISVTSWLQDRAYRASSILRAKTSPYFTDSVVVSSVVDAFTISCLLFVTRRNDRTHLQPLCTVGLLHHIFVCVSIVVGQYVLV